MINIITKLKRNYPNYSDRIDRMYLIAKEIADSNRSLDSMNAIIPTLDAIDAFVLGMITGEMIRDGILRIEGVDNHIERYK
jgi:hypothetical protein